MSITDTNPPRGEDAAELLHQKLGSKERGKDVFTHRVGNYVRLLFSSVWVVNA